MLRKRVGATVSTTLRVGPQTGVVEGGVWSGPRYIARKEHHASRERGVCVMGCK